MFNFFKTYLQSVDMFFARQEQKPVNLIQSQPKTIEPKATPLDYAKVKQALLITEYDDDGEETPVAVAFVTHDNSGMVLMHLYDLGELE